MVEKRAAAMSTNAEQPKPPAALGLAGKRLWRDVIRDAAGQGVSLDARELVWLRSAGKLTDRIAELESAMVDQPLVVPGHAKQPVSHPLLTEIRQHYALLAQTLGRIRVDLVDSGSGELVSGNRHRTAALVRHYPTGRG
jgi:hypothetical protein